LSRLNRSWKPLTPGLRLGEESGANGKASILKINHWPPFLTLLSKLQIDVKNSEANLINYLYGQIDAGSFKFNKLGAQVIANSAIILQGEEYVAEVFLAAIDTTVDPEITVNNRALPIVDGKGIYRLRANETGDIQVERGFKLQNT
jgi:hypothetical protein